MKGNFLGRIGVQLANEKLLKNAESLVKSLNLKAEATPVLISWPGTELDGHLGSMEGRDGHGNALIRLEATGGVFAVPGHRVLAAPAKEKDEKKKEEPKKEEAPKAEEEKAKAAEARKPDPESRGNAPQKEDMKEEAKEKVTELHEPPTELEKMKEGPKNLDKPLAKTAPDAPSPIAALVEEITGIESEKAATQAKLEEFQSGLNMDLIDQRYVKSLKKLYDMIVETGEPVLKLKDQFLAVDVKRSLVEANMSKETQKKYKDLMDGLKAKKTEMAKINKAIKDLEAASFARMGGTEKVQERVATFPKASKKFIEVLSEMNIEAAKNPKVAERVNQLHAGLTEMFNALVDSAKEFVGTLKSLAGLGNDFLKSYTKDMKAAAKEPAMQAAKKLGKILAGLRKLPSGRWMDTNGNSYESREKAAEAEAHGYMDSKMDPESSEYKKEHKRIKRELSNEGGLKAEYNGWPNRATWAVNLWMTNDEASQAALYGFVDANDPEGLREFVEEMVAPVTEEASMAADLLNGALGDVNYNEIIRVHTEDKGNQIDNEVAPTEANPS